MAISTVCSQPIVCAHTVILIHSSVYHTVCTVLPLDFSQLTRYTDHGYISVNRELKLYMAVLLHVDVLLLIVVFPASWAVLEHNKHLQLFLE